MRTLGRRAFRRVEASAAASCRAAATTTTVLLACLIGTTGGAAAVDLPLRINCGGDACRYGEDIHYEADSPYNTAAGFGHVGGEQLRTHPYLILGGTPFPDIYLCERIGTFSYRADLPPGRYLVTLRFASMLYHGRGIGIFDVRESSGWIDRTIDLRARAPRAYAQDIRTLVQINESPLCIDFFPTRGDAEIAALEIVAAPDPLPPLVPPQDLAAWACPGGVFLHWRLADQPHMRAFRVLRSTGIQDRFLPLDRPEHLMCTHWDTTASPGISYRYRVEPVDVLGNAGPCAEIGPIGPLPLAGSNLPTFFLEVEEDSLRWMLESVFENRWIPGKLTPPDCGTRSVRMRIRGGVSRLFQKKSFKIRFQRSQLYNERSVLNLMWKVESTFIREPLAYKLFRGLGIPSPRVSFLHLVLNGESRGVYLNIEQIDDEFLAARGLDPGGSLYEVEGGNMDLPETTADYARLYDKKTGDKNDLSEIVALVELVNLTPDEEFPGAIWNTMDVQGFLDWYAVVVLTANRDITCQNHFLFLPSGSGKWKIFPWDNDLAFSPYTAAYFPLDMGAEWSEPAVPAGPNRLITRILAVDGFRYLYAAKLSQYLEDIFQPEDVEAAVDSLFGLVRADGQRDRLKLTWEDNEAFLDEVEAIKGFVRHRSEYVREKLSNLGRPAGEVRINEIHRGKDGKGGWVELRNAGDLPVAAEELILSDRPVEGTGWELGGGIISPGGYRVVGLGWETAESRDWIPYGFCGEDRCLALYRHMAGYLSLSDLASWPPYLEEGTLVRSEDGEINWIPALFPTPGWPNGEITSPHIGDNARLVIRPSPGGKQVTIECILGMSGSARLDLFDIRGRHVRTLRDGWWNRGATAVCWDGTSSQAVRVSSGTYFLSLSGVQSSSTSIICIR